MVVAKRHTANARKHIKELVAIWVSYIVSHRLMQVDREVSLLVARGLTICVHVLLNLWAWEACFHNWSFWLVWESHTSDRAESHAENAELWTTRKHRESVQSLCSLCEL